MSSVLSKEDQEKISIHNLSLDVSDVLEFLAERFKFDLDDPNLQDTPRRVSKAWHEILSGYDEDPSRGYDQMVVVKDIKFYSTCMHHMMPFYGFVTVGYIPAKKGTVIGLSKIPRLVRCFSRRLQIQERMTEQIARALDHHLKPRGVGVLVYQSVHLCAHMRGIEESHSTMETSALYGEFREDPAVRSEFLRIAGK
jgi:GTP cyclohydrolase I